MSDHTPSDAQPTRDHAASSTDLSLDTFVAAARAWSDGSTTRTARGPRAGVTALISGGSPQERRKAAESVAEATGSTLIRVDLARVVSKSIGETEKNMDALLDRARTSGFVLLFDEADALFGKRTDVKDAHDRYANLEVSYLIQRLESFEGLAILASHRRENIDPAFVRRLRYVVLLPE
ncbi:MAG: ATP-binding protein [Cytophagaceae bacterium]|nr:ATP-binding protein [Gemmatimonadaceae bacterium]